MVEQLRVKGKPGRPGYFAGLRISEASGAGCVQDLGDALRDDVAAAADPAERGIDRRPAERVDDVDLGAALDEILHDALPAESDRAVERRLPLAVGHRARARDARGAARRVRHARVDVRAGAE